MTDIIKDRRIYSVDGRFWMVLTAEELLQWQAEAPHLVHYVNGEACSEIFRKPRES